VVAADGRLLQATADENPDLFWAIRGGGGNFGIVTAFEFELVEFGPPVFGGLILYPAEAARGVLRAYRDWAAAAAEDVTTILLFRHAPPFGWIPPDVRGRPVVAVGALFAGPARDGAAALAPLMDLGPVLADSVRTRSFVEHQSMLDTAAPAGHRYYWKSHYLASLSDSGIDVITDHAWRFTSPLSFTLLAHMGGAIRRRSDDDTAFTGRDAEFTININCVATSTELYATDRDWASGWFDALSPHSTGGVYVNFVGDEGGDRVRAAYGETKLRRLAAVKAEYDPANVFRVNQNIAPLAALVERTPAVR
jgi:FAD/FMN-containing dehydrogenase